MQVTDQNTLPVTVTVLDIKPVKTTRVIALASVELIVCGFAMAIRGIQVARTIQNGREATVVTLPNYRAGDGTWQSAIVLPEELTGPIGDAVLDACIDLGLCQRVPVAAE